LLLRQVITLVHGQKRLQDALEVVPGVYIGGQRAAAAEVATGGLQQVCAAGCGGGGWGFGERGLAGYLQ
jgi:hypothetical protein